MSLLGSVVNLGKGIQNGITKLGKIRNIIQSTQEREVIKQASDIVVYINGQNYLLNDLVGNGGTTIPFNDYVAAFTSNYDIEAMIPTCNVTLAVPIDQDGLFRSPGGNNVIKTMDDIRVFQKGYYLSDKNNSIYYQVFKGYISSIGYTQTQTMTNITLNCSGALGLLEKMQADIAPALMSNAKQNVTALGSTGWNQNPYEMMSWVFMFSSFIDGFNQASLTQQGLKGSPWYGAVQNNFIARWTALLVDLARDVHIFGALDVNDIVAERKANLIKNPASANPENQNTKATASDTRGPLTESDNVAKYDEIVQNIRKYHQDFSIGSIQLLNGKIISRLERLKFAANLIGFEAYQDIDGGIVCKPPTYNLDVMDTTDYTASVQDNTVDKITPERNPFVVYLSEIINESENEDESAVRLTRIIVQGDLTGGANQFMGHEPDAWIGAVEDIDIPKLAQFGLRTEPPHHGVYFQADDVNGLYAFASNELARANLNYLTYNITIPARPELKLGVPMFIPHKDMYGYIKSVSNSFNKGGEATMTVTLNALRRRPLYPVPQPVTDANGVTTTKKLLTPQPNLVMQWTKPPSTDSVSTAQASTPSSKATGKVASLPATTPPPPQISQVDNFLKNKMGNKYSPENDTVDHCWRPQLDTKGVFTSPRSVDATYYKDLRTVRPYTDGKGYELIGVFPWGRNVPLKEALYDFTVYQPNPDVQAQKTQGVVALPANPVNPNTQELTNAASFLFTGTTATSPASDISSPVIANLSQQAQIITSFKVFELDYTSSTVPATVPGNNASTAPNSTTALQNNQDNSTTAAQVFLTGQAPPTNQALQIVNNTQPTPGVNS